MAKAAGYRGLTMWQLGMGMVEQTFAPTDRLPGHQRFCLTDQMRRAAVSVPSNIAEGYAKRSTRDYCRHLKIAAGSLAEWETQLELAVRLGYLTRDDVMPAWSTSQSVAKLLNATIHTLTEKIRQSRRDNPA